MKCANSGKNNKYLKRSWIAVASATLAMTGSAYAQEQTLLLRDPAISASHIAFIYAGDVWLAGLDGSNPQRLTSQPADEFNPVFSPDGSMIAFTANFDGNRDVYVIPVSGGQPQRLTWHPGDDIVLDWSPDGSAVAFASAREFNRGRSRQLYHVSLDGGLPQKQMEARIYRGQYDASGHRFAYHPFPPANDSLYSGWFGWRGHRGGRTPSILIMDLQADTTTSIPGDRVNDLEPMWLGEHLYFLSDREDKTLNLFRFDPSSGEISKASDEKTWDIRAADAYGNLVIYEAGGRLKTLDTASGEVSELPISISPDLSQRRPQMKDASTTIESFNLSPTGQRVAITARGEVFTVPVGDGSARNLTMSDGKREYTALWSPDGSRVAYVDASTLAQELVIEDQTGFGQARRFPLGEAFHQLLEWGGDGSRIIYSNHKLEVRAINTSNGERTLISTGTRMEAVQVDTSPDGRWLAYTEEGLNFYRTLNFYDFASNRSYPVLDGLADVSFPAFSRDGKYLYFAASTNSGPMQSMIDMSTFEKPYRAAIYFAVLAADGESPLNPKPGNEPAASDQPATEEATRIDIKGLNSRIGALPVPETNYSQLALASNGDLFFLRKPQPGTSSAPPGQPAEAENALMRFSFADRKATEVMAGITALAISANGEHLIVRKSPSEFLTADIAAVITPKPLDLSSMQMFIDPRTEWRQIFDEAWLMEQQYFYDPNMHGIDWQAIYDRYSPLVDHVGQREDLNTLLREMLGEMHVGHQFVYGGDTHYKETGADIGLLGADLAMENGHTRIKRIYTGENWNPFIEAPLATPGLDVREGDYILSVNGDPVGAGENIWQLLQGTTGKQTALQVAASPDGSNARTVTVKPVAAENQLRLWAWVEDNRRAVAEATDGRVGYIYVPDTTVNGFTFFNRMFHAQIDKDALIIDDRSNDGGLVANHIVDALDQTYLSGWKSFAGSTYITPTGALYGPKVMLIDQDSQSGGDYLPYAFKMHGIGPLIGTRTWGGLIGVAVNPPLIDGGLALVPYERFFDAEGNWSIENEGVAPDIRVELDPIATNKGRDTQLERAIGEIKRMLKDNPPVIRNAPVPPPYPTEPGE
jgi:tricorn protease